MLSELKLLYLVITRSAQRLWIHENRGNVSARILSIEIQYPLSRLRNWMIHFKGINLELVEKLDLERKFNAEATKLEKASSWLTHTWQNIRNVELSTCSFTC